MFVWFLLICLFVSIGPIKKDVFCISLEQPSLVKLVIKCAQNLSPDAAIFDLAN